MQSKNSVKQFELLAAIIGGFGRTTIRILKVSLRIFLSIDALFMA